MAVSSLTRRSAMSIAPLSVALGFAATGARGQSQGHVLRVGHFPNITHVQGLVAHNMTRNRKGWFEPRLGDGVSIEWFVYNAGPSAMEAIFADSIDLTYVGPGPVINAYARARGEAVRVLAGAVEGGAALVIPSDSTLRTPADFRGRRIATPQLGNTQDVAARAWLTAGGLRITMTGGDAQVVPTANPDQLSLFKTRQIDAVWTVEPWVSRLETEADGKVLVEERDAVTTVLAASTKFLERRRDLARRFVAAHAELTVWIRDNPAEAQRIVRDELVAETRTDVHPDLIARSWNRIVLTDNVPLPALESFVTKSKDAGFLRSVPDLSRLIERP
jgi:NitT/TauT family transport system substrate-binding protein